MLPDYILWGMYIIGFFAIVVMVMMESVYIWNWEWERTKPKTTETWLWVMTACMGTALLLLGFSVWAASAMALIPGVAALVFLWVLGEIAGSRCLKAEIADVKQEIAELKAENMETGGGNSP